MNASRFVRAAVLAVMLSGAAVSATAVADEAAVNINTADAQTLADSLVGVGLSRAQAIIAHREANGPFGSAEDLANVKGIGPSLVEKNRERIKVK